MKKLNILYWIFTVLFALFMLMSGVTNALVTEDSVMLIVDTLGYPRYFVAFIGVAKIIGAIGVLVPGIPRWLKEWAYAGLFFDLIGATYSLIAAAGFDASTLMMLLPFGLGALSYYFYHRRNAQSRSTRPEPA
ncbi:MAG: DoxX family protein [Bacteroidota bacterium]|jgi:uncharacterized membrane protein|nr:MAG: hypothetical protein DIU61_05930 [Bacteroidota bacterium]